MPNDTLVIIPAYSASYTISELIERLAKYVNQNDILVVDDGSKDDTGEIAKKLDIIVVAHDSNMGKGAALKTGFRYALNNGYKAVLTIDADLQHDPDCVPRFLELGATDKYDLIVGVRQRSIDMPRHRIFSNFITSLIVSVFSGCRIRDSQSGYRWIKTDALRNLYLHGDRYDLESEILLKIVRMGRPVAEVDIPTIYGDKSQSHISLTTDTLRFIGLIWRSFFW